MTNATEPRAVVTRGRPWLRPAVLVGLVILVLFAARYFHVGIRIRGLRDWIQSLGAWGPAAFVLLYAGATVAVLPGSVLTAAAGVLFGALKGTIVVSIASTLGATLSFLIGRYFARKSVEEWLGKSERFQKLDSLTEKHGDLIVAITRLVPLFPFNFLNYSFGLTKVKLRTYVFWSWLAMLPMTVVFVVGTDAITTAVEQGRVPWTLVIALAAMLVMLAFLVRHARGRLRAAESASQRHSQEDVE